MTVARWQLWYEDGHTVVGGTQEEWDAAPGDGVIYGMIFFDDGTAGHLTGKDILFCHDFGQGTVITTDDDRDSLLRRLPWVKFGRWTSIEQYARVQEEATKVADVWYASVNGPSIEYKGCCP